MILLRVVVFVAGAVLALGTLRSAVRAFVLPRGSHGWAPRWTFFVIRMLFDARVRLARSYAARDRAMALYAPAGLIALEGVWLAVEALAFTAMFWALRPRPLAAAFAEGASSLTTLGFAEPRGIVEVTLAFFGAAIGLTLVALLISYLPTMYSVFSRRETLVATLDARAGVPPSGVELLARSASQARRETFQESLNDTWNDWERWFADIEETHTTFPAITFFRSPQPHRSWVTAAGAVLDAAALTVSTLNLRRDGQASLCLEAGFRALVRVGEFLQLDVDGESLGDVPVSVSRAEFEAAVDRLVRAGLPVVGNRDEAWRGFVSWRRRYDHALLALADLVVAPPAPWSSDRSSGRRRARVSSLQRREARPTRAIRRESGPGA